AHEFESFLIARGEAPDVDEAFFDVVHQYQDKLLSGTDKVKARVAGHLPDGLEDVLAAQGDAPLDWDQPSHEEPAPEPVTAAEPVATEVRAGADILPFAPKPKAPVAEAPVAPASGTLGGGAATSMTARRSGPQEVVKVSAEL